MAKNLMGGNFDVFDRFKLDCRIFFKASYIHMDLIYYNINMYDNFKYVEIINT